MEETAQYFEKQFFINSFRFSFLPKFYATHQNYEIFSKSLVSSPRPYFWDALKTFSGSYGEKVPDPQHWSDAMKIKTIHSTAALVFA
jgi:hypothetical protein